MDLLFVLGVLAIAASLGSLVARGLRPRRWPLPAVLAVVVGTLGHLFASPWAIIAAVALTLFGVMGPAWVASRARRRAMRGDFAGAARLAGVLSRVLPGWSGWQALWRAADRWYAGDGEAAHRLAMQLAVDPSPESRMLREALMGLTRDWPAARFARSIDLQSRALCELGELDAGIETAARAWPPRMRWVGVRRARSTALAPLAFAGDVQHLDALTTQMRLPPAARDIWRATARAAAGEPTAAARLLAGVTDDDDIPPAVRHAARARRAALPEPRPIGAAAQQVLDDLSAEVRAGDVLRTRSVLGSPLSVFILLLMALGYALQLKAGDVFDGRIAYDLGALYAEGRWPEDRWRLLTYGFLHAGPLHLAANALALVILGPMVDRALGVAWTLIVFVGGVLLGGIGISLLGAEGITVGASAGAMALLGAVVVVTLAHPAVRHTRTGRAAARLGLMLIVLQTALDAVTPMISSAGHISGGVAGLLIGAMALALRRRRPTQPSR